MDEDKDKSDVALQSEHTDNEVRAPNNDDGDGSGVDADNVGFDIDSALSADTIAEKSEDSLFGGESPLPVKEEKKAAKKVKRRKVKREVHSGRAYIKATYNNTIVTLTDNQGNVIAWSSSGNLGFKGPKKATPYAAGIVVKSVVQKIYDVGMKEVDVFLCGVGQGREAALRALNAQGMKIISIKDVTPIPHNGCRPAKPRRV